MQWRSDFQSGSRVLEKVLCEITKKKPKQLFAQSRFTHLLFHLYGIFKVLPCESYVQTVQNMYGKGGESL